ncbi:hypothetical protein NA56DRAFT_571372 [Hyaloscypha hepaticicola]|uniref:DUF1308 domain-containing protein n=1 Tax=Hyaloscypha hepaticicola TaxID=2082293 RepID=A0A2J6Q6P4_9HELO|nr:hypothetical protein NA56DRAFT_571372 [Hyaloscypha hepaticicola]
MDKADEIIPSPPQGDLADSDPSIEVKKLAADMQQRCRLFLDELEQFQTYLKDQRKEKHVDLRIFRSGLQSEMKMLDKLATADPKDPKTSHNLRSSNFSFFDAVWSIAKTCSNLTALQKRFYWLPGRHAPFVNGKVATTGPRHRTYSAVVSIVAQSGLEWIKVSSITEKRIIWDLTKSGWVAESSSEESEDIEDDNDDESEGLLKQVEALVKACHATRVRYQHPKIRLVLPRIKAQPDSKEVANLLQQIRNLGVTIQTMEDMPPEFPPIIEVLDRLAIDPFVSFSGTLNIDCTILLAFVSDLSHGRVEPADWHNKAISRQIEMENEDQLLQNSVWPSCGSRKLICTREAAVRMQEIVDTIGTETEKKRAALLFPLGNDFGLSREQLLEEFQQLSDYTVPPEWNLPIKVLDVDMNAIMSQLPPIAQKVSELLAPINRSVFLYGWATSMTTISSNAVVAREIEKIIEEENESFKKAGGPALSQNIKGPEIWLGPSARSLVGKEKNRRGANGDTS